MISIRIVIAYWTMRMKEVDKMIVFLMISLRDWKDLIINNRK